MLGDGGDGLVVGSLNTMELARPGGTMTATTGGTCAGLVTGR